MNLNLRIRKGIGWYLLLTGLFLIIWKVRTLSVDPANWRDHLLDQDYWLEFFPFFYFIALLLAGLSLVWRHRFSLLLVFAYAGFTLEELILGYFSSTAVPFSTLSHWCLLITVLGAVAGMYLIKREQGKTPKKYRFRALWFGVAFGLGTNLLFTVLGF